MAERCFAAVLLLLFGCFLYIAGSDIMRVVGSRDFANTFLLLFCVIASAGWMTFLAALSLASPTGQYDPAGRPAWKAA
jgi:hypothetical protein